MTREECIGLLKRYAEYNGMGIPNLAGSKEAMRMAADLLSQPSLPSNLDEAAVEQANLIYPENIRMGHVAKHDVNLLTRRGFIKGFKAGAKWMAGQGYDREVEVKRDAGGYPYIPCIELYDYDKDEPLSKPGDKVVVQIRKK